MDTPRLVRRNQIFSRLQPGDEVTVTLKPETGRAPVVGHVRERVSLTLTVNDGCCDQSFKLKEIYEIATPGNKGVANLGGQLKITGTITTEQRVMVGKDRLLDDLNNLRDDDHSYWTLEDRARVRRLAALLALDDDSEETLKALTDAGYINGIEELFFGKASF